MPENEAKGSKEYSKVETKRKAERRRRGSRRKVQRVKLAAMMNEPKLISSRFNYNDVDNNIIRA